MVEHCLGAYPHGSFYQTTYWADYLRSAADAILYYVVVTGTEPHEVFALCLVFFEPWRISLGAVEDPPDYDRSFARRVLEAGARHLTGVDVCVIPWPDLVEDLLVVCRRNGSVAS